ncbi:MAG: glutathione S-transferase [Alphaproteobacteria bacterium]|nr:glutathione S-transferase [Alphaproteobacteria bacterium]
MKIMYVPASPYVRKALVTVIEKGLADKVEKVRDNPFEETTKIPDFNPAGKVPTLIRDDGGVLFDSPVICEYLDSVGTGPKLFPSGGEARWTALRRQALGDAALDAIVVIINEMHRRPADKQHPPVVERQARVLTRCFDMMERDAAALGNDITVGHIAYGIALGHLDFREEMVGGIEWRTGRPKLAAWFATFNQRPSMQATIPHI